MLQQFCIFFRALFSDTYIRMLIRTTEVAPALFNVFDVYPYADPDHDTETWNSGLTV